MRSTSNPSGLSRWTPAVADPGPRTVPTTAIVLTLNEAYDIERCVRSLGWCDQVVIVDSHSTDATVQIAESLGAEVLHHAFEGFGAQRQWALEHPNVLNDWVLFLDADEWCSDALASEIAGAIRRTDASGFAMRRRLIFQGQWIKYAGWYKPSWLVRLVRRDHAKWHGEVSEKLTVNGRIEPLKHDLVDEDSKGLEAWLSRHNRYSSLKARQREALRSTSISHRWAAVRSTGSTRALPREVAKQLFAPSLPAPGFHRFIYMYVLRGGFLMGRVGLRFCLLHAMQEMHINMKIEETERTRLPARSKPIEPMR